MRKIVILGALGASLAAIPAAAAPYDHAAYLPAKAAADAQAMACMGVTQTVMYLKEPTTSERGTRLWAATIECMVSGERAFATAIKLERKDLLEAYIAQYRAALSAPLSGGTTPGDAVGKNMKEVRDNFLKAILALDGWNPAKQAP